ncbi:O-antigen ligase family protein [Falsiroseomonas sp. HW251]|uniref:O-antigen ligase family protein n=1 Tax=Falsiroseomonas sp. HW251 TaxID=3390998 RepID=UPI003D31B8BC
MRAVPQERFRAAAMRPARRTEAERARRRWMQAAVPALVCIVLAFHQVLPKPPATSSDFSPSRGLELLLIGAAVLIAMTLPARRHALPPVSGWAMGLVLSFAGWAFITSIWSPLPLTGAVKAIELAAISVVGWRIASSAPGEGEERRRAVSDAVLRALMFAVAVLIVCNTIAMRNPLPIVTDEEPGFSNEGQRDRLMLGFNHPLSSAAMLAFGVVFAYDTNLKPASKVAAMGFLGVLLLLCDARGLTAAIPVGIALGLWFRAKPSLIIAWIGLIAVVAVVGGVALLLAYVDPVTLLIRAFGEDAVTLNSRAGLWAYVIDIAMQYPLGGVGFFGTRFYILAAFPFAGHAHNSFLEVFVSTGLPGLALLLGFVGLAIGRLLRSGDPLLAGLMPLVLAEGNLNPLFFVPAVPMMLFTLALFVASPREASASSRAPAALRPAAAWR